MSLTVVYRLASQKLFKGLLPHSSIVVVGNGNRLYSVKADLKLVSKLKKETELSLT